MRGSLTIFVFLTFLHFMSSQDYLEISCGAGYNKQSYVNLANETQKTVNNDAWDIAFTAFGVQDAGIFINESSGSSLGQNLPTAEVYFTYSDDFNSDFDISILEDNTLLNDELSWNYGAFNGTRDTLNAFDFGWGQYEPTSHGVIGYQVFIVKLRNGDYKKIFFESLVGTAYTFKYANLDGTNLVTKTIDKTVDGKGKSLIFFNLSSNSVVDVLPDNGYDFMYGRYISIATDPNGTIIQQYNVTGVLSAPGVSCVSADNVDFNTVNFDDYKDGLSEKMDVIGYDWKTFSGTGWSLDDNRVFFLKSTDNTVWKLQFIDFEGSSTGTAVLSKENLGKISATEEVEVQVLVYPNPTHEQLSVLSPEKIVNFTFFDASGRMSYSVPTERHDGSLYVYTFDVSNMANGIYVIQGNSASEKSLKTKFVKE